MLRKMQRLNLPLVSLVQTNAKIQHTESTFKKGWQCMYVKEVEDQVRELFLGKSHESHEVLKEPHDIYTYLLSIVEFTMSKEEY